MLVKLDHFPKDRGEHEKYLKPLSELTKVVKKVDRQASAKQRRPSPWFLTKDNDKK